LRHLDAVLAGRKGKTTTKRRKNMKKTAVLIALAALALSAPAASFAAEHGSMQMEHGGQMKTDSIVAYEGVVDGVNVTFKVLDMREHMKSMKMEMPKGMKDTHHLMVEFKDAKTGKALSEGEVKVKVIAPDKTEQVKDLVSMVGMGGMGAGFGADFNFSGKGKYAVMAKFKLAAGKVRSVKFWYTVK
jgi:hypothetical protein